MSYEKTLFSKLIYDGRVLRLRVDSVVRPDGHQTTREIVEHCEVVAIVAVDPDSNILLVRQFRTPTGKELLEIPAGGIEAGEMPQDAVYREMQEETGYRPQRVERLGGFYSAPGFCTEYLYLYLATDLVPGRLQAEDTDEIELLRVPVSQAIAMIASGDICDSKSIAGLLSYLEYQKAR
jgi:ADP-ribose pyrophosphatase